MNHYHAKTCQTSKIMLHNTAQLSLHLHRNPMSTPSPSPEKHKQQLIASAKALGFDAIGFAKPELAPHHFANLPAFTAAHFHGDMHWLEDRQDQRANPKTLWPEVQTVLMLGMNYAPPDNPLHRLQHTGYGVISCYAEGKDYHDVLKGRLKQLAGQVVKLGGDVKVFVDTAPVMEKPLAASAGLGWQGKHTCIVSREFGSWLFLGALYTTLALPPDQTEEPAPFQHCGSCTACIDICPTGAIVAPGQLDARKCIAYLTIEHEGDIPEEYHAAIGNRIFGCDDCLAACPWNKYAKESQHMAFAKNRIQENLQKLYPNGLPHSDNTTPPTSPQAEALGLLPLSFLLTLNEPTFRQLFAGTPIKRTGYHRFMRNVRIAWQNSLESS